MPAALSAVAAAPAADPRVFITIRGYNGTDVDFALHPLMPTDELFEQLIAVATEQLDATLARLNGQISTSARSRALQRAVGAQLQKMCAVATRQVGNARFVLTSETTFHTPQRILIFQDWRDDPQQRNLDAASQADHRRQELSNAKRCRRLYASSPI